MGMESNGVNIPPKALIFKVFTGHCWIVMESKIGIPYGIRTRVAAVKGRCPRPLDERDALDMSKDSAL